VASVTSSLAFALPAQANAGVTVIQYSLQGSLARLPSRLPWSKTVALTAKTFIDRDRKRIEHALALLSHAGAVSVRSVNAPIAASGIERKIGAPVPEILVGYSKTGRKVAEQGPFPGDPKDFAAAATRLARTPCSLNFAANLNSPYPQCQARPASVDNYLKNSLKSFALYSQPGDAYSFRIQELNYIVANNLKFSIRGGQIVCPELSKLSPNETAISLSDKSAIGGYTITVTEDGSGFTFTEIAPDFVRLARDAYVLPGETWIRFQ